MMAEESLDHIYCQLSLMGSEIDKQALKEHLLEPGEKRLQFIKWVLKQLDIMIKEDDSITKVMTDFGFCSSSESHIITEKCTPEESLKFWKKLFDIIHLYKGGKPAVSQDAYKTICDFWIAFSTNSKKKDALQPKKQEHFISVNVHKNLPKNVSKEELIKERISEECILKELENQKEVLQVTEYKEKYSSTECDRVIGELLHNTANFQQYMANSLMPWLHDTCESPQQNDYSELLPELSREVQKLKMVYKNAEKIHEGMGAISSMKLEEPSLCKKVELPNFRKHC